MGFETGDSISFILSIFTVILTIIPSIVPTQSINSPLTNLPLFQATIDLIKDNSKNNTFFAQNILHKPMKSNIFITNDNVSNYRVNTTNVYQDFASAIEVYNNGSVTTKSSAYNIAINNLNKSLNFCKNLLITNDVCKNLWFTIRILDLQINHGHNVTEDRFNCLKIANDTGKCSYEELKNLNKINLQANKGFINFFYNERNITSLEKPIESFVSGLNNFFIAILLSGPSIFLTFITIKSKNGKKGE